MFFPRSFLLNPVIRHKVPHNPAATVWTARAPASAAHTACHTLPLEVRACPALSFLTTSARNIPFLPPSPARLPVCEGAAGVLTPSPLWNLLGLARCEFSLLRLQSSHTWGAPAFQHYPNRGITSLFSYTWPMDTSRLKMQTNSHSSCYTKARQSTLSKYMSPRISRDDGEERKKCKAEDGSKQQLICKEQSHLVRPKWSFQMESQKQTLRTSLWRGSGASKRMAFICDYVTRKTHCNNWILSRRSQAGRCREWSRHSYTTAAVELKRKTQCFTGAVWTGGQSNHSRP